MFLSSSPSCDDFGYSGKDSDGSVMAAVVLVGVVDVVIVIDIYLALTVSQALDLPYISSMATGSLDFLFPAISSSY